MTTSKEAAEFLRVWERGIAQSPGVRALLLLCAAAPDTPPDVLASWSVGHRDAELLSLRERTFGPTIHALATCPACEDAIQLTFDVNDVRAGHAAPLATFAVERGRGELLFRCPNSADVIAAECACDESAAEQLLVTRCRVEGVDEGDGWSAQARVDVLPEVARALEAIDPQAHVRLDTTCPVCDRRIGLDFDVATYLWAELDRWARRLLRESHVLAAAYGWAESEILGMSAMRRQVYLELLGA